MEMAKMFSKRSCKPLKNHAFYGLCGMFRSRVGDYIFFEKSIKPVRCWKISQLCTVLCFPIYQFPPAYSQSEWTGLQQKSWQRSHFKEQGPVVLYGLTPCENPFYNNIISHFHSKLISGFEN
jgi:hypothetical protein